MAAAAAIVAAVQVRPDMMSVADALQLKKLVAGVRWCRPAAYRWRREKPSARSKKVIAADYRFRSRGDPRASTSELRAACAMALPCGDVRAADGAAAQTSSHLQVIEMSRNISKGALAAVCSAGLELFAAAVSMCNDTTHSAGNQHPTSGHMVCKNRLIVGFDPPRVSPHGSNDGEQVWRKTWRGAWAPLQGAVPAVPVRCDVPPALGCLLVAIKQRSIGHISVLTYAKSVGSMGSHSDGLISTPEKADVLRYSLSIPTTPAGKTTEFFVEENTGPHGRPDVVTRYHSGGRGLVLIAGDICMMGRAPTRDAQRSATVWMHGSRQVPLALQVPGDETVDALIIVFSSKTPPHTMAGVIATSLTAGANHVVIRAASAAAAAAEAAHTPAAAPAAAAAGAAAAAVLGSQGGKSSVSSERGRTIALCANSAHTLLRSPHTSLPPPLASCVRYNVE